MPTLYVLSGPDVGTSVELIEGSIVGRATEAKLRLRDRSISRKHARLERREGSWVLADLNSRNGLFDAGGERVRHVELEDGLELRLGEVELRVRIEQSAPKRAAAPAPSPPVAEEIELDEIDLEDPDEIDLGSDSPAPTPPPVKEKAPPGAPRGMRGAREAAPPPSTAKKKSLPAGGGFGGNDLERTTLTARAAARAGVNMATAPANKDILQYSHQPKRGGLLAADLEQQPLWKRVLLTLFALVFAGALAFGIWQAVMFLKARNAPLDFEGNSSAFEEEGE